MLLYDYVSKDDTMYLQPHWLKLTKSPTLLEMQQKEEKSSSTKLMWKVQLIHAESQCFIFSNFKKMMMKKLF